MTRKDEAAMTVAETVAGTGLDGLAWRWVFRIEHHSFQLLLTQAHPVQRDGTRS
jgi:hypothetical protein